MKKIPLAVLFLLGVSALAPKVCAQEENMKKAVMIIAQKDFRDEELIVPIDILEENDIEITVASQSLDEAKGMLGAKVKPDITLGDIKSADFDAIIFVGGSGAEAYWDNSVAQGLARDAANTDKVLAAICIAPVILAKAGVLKGKNATVFDAEAALLTQAGAKYTGKPVERDGLIITASGPQAAAQFAREIVKALNK